MVGYGDSYSTIHMPVQQSGTLHYTTVWDKSLESQKSAVLKGRVTIQRCRGKIGNWFDRSCENGGQLQIYISVLVAGFCDI